MIAGTHLLRSDEGWEVHLGDRWLGTINITAGGWSFATRPFGPPTGTITGGGYRDLRSAVNACVAASLR